MGRVLSPYAAKIGAAGRTQWAAEQRSTGAAAKRQARTAKLQPRNNRLLGLHARVINTAHGGTCCLLRNIVPKIGSLLLLCMSKDPK
jgi:hypothetical protein